MKFDNYQLAEDYLLKAQQMIQLDRQDSNWTQYEDYHFQNISISVQLSNVYKKMKYLNQSLSILQKAVQEAENSPIILTILQNPESFIHMAYFQLGELCFYSQQYEKAVDYYTSCINTINELHVLQKTQKLKLVQNQSFYQMGKCFLELNESQKALECMKEAYQEGQQIYDPEDIRLLKYKQKYEQLKNKLEFEQLLDDDSNLSFQQFAEQANKQNNKIQNSKIHQNQYQSQNSNQNQNLQKTLKKHSPANKKLTNISEKSKTNQSFQNNNNSYNNVPLNQKQQSIDNQNLNTQSFSQNNNKLNKFGAQNYKQMKSNSQIKLQNQDFQSNQNQENYNQKLKNLFQFQNSQLTRHQASLQQHTQRVQLANNFLETNNNNLTKKRKLRLSENTSFKNILSPNSSTLKVENLQYKQQFRKINHNKSKSQQILNPHFYGVIWENNQEKKQKQINDIKAIINTQQEKEEKQQIYDEINSIMQGVEDLHGNDKFLNNRPFNTVNLPAQKHARKESLNMIGNKEIKDSKSMISSIMKQSYGSKKGQKGSQMDSLFDNMQDSRNKDSNLSSQKKMEISKQYYLEPSQKYRRKSQCLPVRRSSRQSKEHFNNQNYNIMIKSSTQSRDKKYKRKKEIKSKSHFSKQPNRLSINIDSLLEQTNKIRSERSAKVSTIQSNRLDQSQEKNKNQISQQQAAIIIQNFVRKQLKKQKQKELVILQVQKLRKANKKKQNREILNKIFSRKIRKNSDSDENIEFDLLKSKMNSYLQNQRDVKNAVKYNKEKLIPPLLFYRSIYQDQVTFWTIKNVKLHFYTTVHLVPIIVSSQSINQSFEDDESNTNTQQEQSSLKMTKINKERKLIKSLEIFVNINSTHFDGIFKIKIEELTNQMLEKPKSYQTKWGLASDYIQFFLQQNLLENAYQEFEKSQEKQNQQIKFQKCNDYFQKIFQYDNQQFRYYRSPTLQKEMNQFSSLIEFLLLRFSKQIKKINNNKELSLQAGLLYENQEIDPQVKENLVQSKTLNYEANQQELAQFLKERNEQKKKLANNIEFIKPQVFIKAGFFQEKKNYQIDYNLNLTQQKVQQKKNIQFPQLNNQEFSQLEKKQSGNLFGSQFMLQSKKSNNLNRKSSKKNLIANRTASIASQSNNSSFQDPDLSQIYKDTQQNNFINFNFSKKQSQGKSQKIVELNQKQSIAVKNYFDFNEAQIYKEIPDLFINPFYEGQVLFKGLNKRQKYFFHEIKIVFEEMSLYTVENPSEFKIIIYTFMQEGLKMEKDIGKKQKNSILNNQNISLGLIQQLQQQNQNINSVQLNELQYQLDEFISIFLAGFDFKFSHFLYQKGFSRQQKQHINLQLQHLITIQNNEIKIPSDQEILKSVITDQQKELESQIRQNNFQQSLQEKEDLLKGNKSEYFSQDMKQKNILKRSQTLRLQEKMKSQIENLNLILEEEKDSSLYRQFQQDNIFQQMKKNETVRKEGNVTIKNQNQNLNQNQKMKQAAQYFDLISKNNQKPEQNEFQRNHTLDHIMLTKMNSAEKVNELSVILFGRLQSQGAIKNKGHISSHSSLEEDGNENTENKKDSSEIVNFNRISKFLRENKNRNSQFKKTKQLSSSTPFHAIHRKQNAFSIPIQLSLLKTKRNFKKLQQRNKKSKIVEFTKTEAENYFAKVRERQVSSDNEENLVPLHYYNSYNRLPLQQIKGKTQIRIITQIQMQKRIERLKELKQEQEYNQIKQKIQSRRKKQKFVQINSQNSSQSFLQSQRSIKINNGGKIKPSLFILEENQDRIKNQKEQHLNFQNDRDNYMINYGEDYTEDQSEKSVVQDENQQEKEEEYQMQRTKNFQRNQIQKKTTNYTYLEKKKLYAFWNLQSFKNRERIHIKIEFQLQKGTTDVFQSAVIYYYNPLNFNQDRVEVKGKENLAKLINLIQVNNFQNNSLQQRLFIANLKRNGRLIGRKLSFRSFVEQDISVLNFHMAKKFNPNDNSLFKMLQNTEFLNNSVQEQLKFLHKIKLALISSDINSELSQENFFLSTYFVSQRVKQQSRIKNFGIALIQTVIYRTNYLYTDNQSVFIRIDVSSTQNKTKSFKFILDLSDVQSLIMEEFNRQNCLDITTIYEMVHKLSQKIVYSNTNTYSLLKIPMNMISQNSSLFRYDLLNSFQNNIINETGTKNNHTMLTYVLRSLKVIYQCTKRIGSNYVVITIRRIQYFNYFCIQIYIPKTSRQFVTFIKNTDFNLLDPKFMEQLFPSVFWSHPYIVKDLKDVQGKSYSEFCKKYRIISENPMKTIEYFQNQISKAQSEYQNMQRSRMRKKTQQKKTFLNFQEQQRAKGQRVSTYSNFGLQMQQSKQNPNVNTNFQANNPSILNQTLQTIKSNQTFNNNNSSNMLYSQKQEMSQNIEKEQFKGIHFDILEFQQLLSQAQDNSQSISQKSNVSEQKLASFGQNFKNQKIQENSQQSLGQPSYCMNPSLFTHLFDDSELDAVKFLEIQIWEQLLNSTVIKKNKQGNFIFHLNTYQGILREILSLSVVNFNEENNIFFELYIENKNKPLYDLFDPYQSIVLAESFDYDLYINVRFFEKCCTLSDKIILRHIINSYFKEQSSKLKNFVKIKDKQPQNHISIREPQEEEYEYIQSDLQQISIFIQNKIKECYLLSNPEQLFQDPNQYLTEQQFRALSLRKAKIKGKQILSLDKRCPQLLKVNFKIYKDQILFNDKRYLVLYRAVFTIKPMQMIAICYRPKKQRFYVLIWNTKNAVSFFRKVAKEEILFHIPYVKLMLSLKQYHEIGE